MENVWEILKINADGYDRIIFICAIITFFVWAYIFYYSVDFGKYFSAVYKERKENGLKREIVRKIKNASEAKMQIKHTWQNCWYGVFVNLVSIFPLLGMIGTVLALLNVDVTDDIGTNFFSALTSTLWGAIFGILFKLLDVFPNYFVERNNESYRIGIQRGFFGAEENGDDNEKKQDIP